MFRSFRKASGLLVCISRPPTPDPWRISALKLSSAAPSPVDYQSVAGNDQDLLKKLKILELEVDVHRQDGLKVPSTITSSQWKELLELKSRSQRLKHLSFWWLKEIKKAGDKRKKEERRKEREEQRPEPEDCDHIKYGFAGSTIFVRIYPSKIDAFHNHKLIRAMMFGQSLVLDCGYDKYMTPKEANNCAKQLMILFAENRNHDDPFNLHFCNANKDSRLMKALHKFIPTLYDDTFPINITEKSYLEVFPKENLVYLTPHCREDLTTFSHDDVYIVGGMVDKVNTDPLSLAKAKSEGLRMARLPLDRYLTWCIGSKSLTVNQMISILLDIKTTGDWNKALVHVPKRKLYNEREHLERDPVQFERKRLATRKMRQDFHLRYRV